MKGLNGGLKAFTALNDYYVHLQIRDVDQFPVPSLEMILP